LTGRCTFVSSSGLGAPSTQFAGRSGSNSSCGPGAMRPSRPSACGVATADPAKRRRQSRFVHGHGGCQRLPCWNEGRPFGGAPPTSGQNPFTRATYRIRRPAMRSLHTVVTSICCGGLLLSCNSDESDDLCKPDDADGIVNVDIAVAVRVDDASFQ